MNISPEVPTISNDTKNTSFPKETAGRIMTTGVPMVLESFSIGEAESLILKKIREFETINYIYVVGKNKKLKGVVSIKEVFRQAEDKKISDIMERSVISARAHTDQEKLVSLALKHSLKAVPVVGKEGVFLGVVPSDVILNVLHSEHSEDVLYGAGVLNVNSASGIIEGSVKSILKSRIPWLVVGLLGGIVAAIIMGRFENLLEEQIMLALFVPVMVYMSDAVRSQTQTIFIRAMAMDKKFMMGKYFKKEIIIGVFLAIFLSLLLGIIVWAWFKTFAFALVISISLLVTIFTAVLIALVVPVIFLALKRDTAVGSGPFSTIISDILSITVYFGVAYFLLNLFAV